MRCVEAHVHVRSLPRDNTVFFFIGQHTLPMFKLNFTHTLVYLCVLFQLLLIIYHSFLHLIADPQLCLSVATFNSKPTFNTADRIPVEILPIHKHAYALTDTHVHRAIQNNTFMVLKFPQKSRLTCRELMLELLIVQSFSVSNLYFASLLKSLASLLNACSLCRHSCLSSAVKPGF